MRWNRHARARINADHAMHKIAQFLFHNVDRFFGQHPPVDAQRHPVGNDVRIDSAFDRADDQRRRDDSRHRRADAGQFVPMVVQGR